MLNEDGKIICFHSSLKSTMESEFPTRMDNFNYLLERDEDRLKSLQRDNNECDGVVISQYSLASLATQVENQASQVLLSCRKLYPLYERKLFSLDVIVPISQTLGVLGDELTKVMNTMLAKRLYSDRHDIYANVGRECEFEALGEPAGVSWKSFATPLLFSCGLAIIGLITGFLKYSLRKRRNASVQSSSDQDVRSSQDLTLLDREFDFIVNELHDSINVSASELNDALSEFPKGSKLLRLYVQHEIEMKENSLIPTARKDNTYE